MNFLDSKLPQAREAKIKYGSPDYQVLREGEYVRCGITGDVIRLENLRYWDVDRQMAYRSADVAFGELLKRGYIS
jgi:hypothetical protein